MPERVYVDQIGELVKVLTALVDEVRLLRRAVERRAVLPMKRNGEWRRDDDS
jgi:hypothetical protein